MNKVKLCHSKFREFPLGYRTLLLTLLPGLLAASVPVYADDTVNLTITGTLRKTACQLVPEDQNLTVDLQTINSRDLELAPSPARLFVIRLKNCDVDAKEATVTIKGLAASEKNSHLALDAESQAQGFAIGFKQGKTMGDELALNTSSSGQALEAGDSSLSFGAYAQKLDGVPLTMGNFTAKATIEIAYP